MEWNPAGVAEVTIGGAVVFIMGVNRFVRMDALPAAWDGEGDERMG
jgi:hypothetical protein